MPSSVKPSGTSESASPPRTLPEPPSGDSSGQLRRVSKRVLLWSEWFSHSKLLLVFLCAWLLLFWAIPLAVHPLWILAFAVLFSLVSGPAFGGADVIDGCEEFIMAMPATRSGRFRARLAMGAGGVALFTLMDLAALGLNLSDVLARVFLSTGLIQPVQLNQPGLLYGLVAAFPFAVFSFGFSTAAMARTRTVAFTSWLWGSLFALGILRTGLELEEWKWERFNGRIATPLLSLASCAVLMLADRLYRSKEAGTEASPLRIPLSWWAWMLAVLVAALGVLALIHWFASNFGRLL